MNVFILYLFGFFQDAYKINKQKYEREKQACDNNLDIKLILYHIEDRWDKRNVDKYLYIQKVLLNGKQHACYYFLYINRITCS